MPIGSILWLSISTIPNGYLECNGQTVNSALYPKLAKFMSTTPNLSGKFIRARSAWEGLGAMTDYTAITLSFDNSFSHGEGLVYDWGNDPDTTYIAGVARGADGHYINYPIVGEKTFIGQFTPMHMALIPIIKAK